MSHLPDLISDLALILISAGIITLLFKWLKQPLVLGYIVAGLLAGPYVQIFPTVVDVENINLWAEMGVVFLLFALGLEFSFKKLYRFYYGDDRGDNDADRRLSGRASAGMVYDEFHISGRDAVDVVDNDHYKGF